MYEVLELKFKHKGCAIASGFVSLLLLSQVQFHKEDSLFSIIWSSLIVFLVFFFFVLSVQSPSGLVVQKETQQTIEAV